jgi:hypothetical protein
MKDKQNIQQVNSELRTVAAEELQKAIASELESLDSAEVDLETLLLAEEKDSE